MSERESVGNHESYMTVNEAGVLVPDYDQTIKIFDDGDIVVGEVVKVDRDEVLVDIGYKSEGAIPARELSIRSDIDPSEIVNVGDRIEALVLQKEDKDGRLILSKKRAEYERAWGRIEEVAKSEGMVTGTVIEVVKGGLIVDIGLRGFLPASLVDIRRTKDLGQFLSQEITCRIIEMDRNRNNVVLSRRAVLEEEKKHEKSKVLEKITKGAVLSGKISSIVDFGAFVDLGGIDGLIHISELCWNHIDHPSEVVSVGDEVNVQVLDVELERERISLGLRQTQDDPWKKKVSKYTVGQVVQGKVMKIVPFGAFVQLEEGLEGLIHISELSYKHVEMPEEVVKVGDDVEAKIVGIDVDRRRVSLSIKQTQELPKEAKTSDEGAEAEQGTAQEPERPETTEEALEEAAEAVGTQANTAGGEIADVATTGEEQEEEVAVAAEESTSEESTSEAVALVSEEEVSVEAIGEELEDAEAEVSLEVDVSQAVGEIIGDTDPGSLEDVLKKMKEEHTKKAPAE